MSDRYHQRRRADEDEIDDLGHVNNVVYLRWVQEIATAHWNTLAPESARRDLVWVVRRHEIDYRFPISAGTQVDVATWIGEAEGLSFERHTEILVGGRVCARARTLWIPINVETGRPQRVSEEVRALFST